MIALPPLRQWQTAALGVADQTLIAETKSHLYVSAPTASGKSRFMFEACERLDVGGERVILVGINQVVEQHRDSFKVFGCVPLTAEPDCMSFLSPGGRLITITTWQSLGRKTPRPLGVMMFDECHIGGTTEEAVTVRNILANFQPSKRVYVSATTQTANEGILGPKGGHFYRYSYAEAYEDGILNSLDLVEVHTGVNADIQAVQNATGKNMSELEELKSSDLHDLAEKLESKSVAYGLTADDVEAKVAEIIRYRHICMSELYLAKHAGEQAIFFSPNIAAAERAVLDFNSRSRLKRKGVRAEVCHSQSDQPSELVRRFKNGSIRVIFVVGMLQEGFDLDTLWLGFDCRFHGQWNSGRISRFVQRMGRLMRKSPDKPTSLYYYARDVWDFYRHDVTYPSDPIMEEDSFEETVEDDCIDDIADVEEAAPIFGARVLHTIETQESDETVPVWEQTVDVYQSEIETVEVEDDDGVTPPQIVQIRTARTPLYVIKRVRDYEIVRTYNVARLFENSAAANKAKLIEMARNGEKRPNAMKTKIGAALSRYTHKSSEIYDCDFHDLIRSIRPDWFDKTADANKEKLLILAGNLDSKRPNSRTTLGSALCCYTNKKKSQYDVFFDSEIRSLRPDWFMTTRDHLLTLARCGGEKPPYKDRLGKAFNNLMSDDVHFRDEILSTRKDWCEKSTLSKAEEYKERILELAKNGSPKPVGRTCDLGKALGRYISKKNRSYDPVFCEELLFHRPEWRPKTLTEETEHQLMLRYSQGLEKPRLKSLDAKERQLCQAWVAYTCARGLQTDPLRWARLREACPNWCKSTA